MGIYGNSYFAFERRINAMMLSIHAAVSISTAPVFYQKINTEPQKLKSYAIPLVFNVALHGVMDLLPHSHPISSYADGIIALLMAVVVLLFVRKKYLLLVLSCYLGGILPDVIDLGVFRVLSLNSLKVFPWHYITVYNFLNTIYTSRSINTLFNVLGISLCLFFILWKKNNMKSMLRL